MIFKVTDNQSDIAFTTSPASEPSTLWSHNHALAPFSPSLTRQLTDTDRRDDDREYLSIGSLTVVA